MQSTTERGMLLDRLAFNLPPFVRQQWASDQSRERWHPQIAAARKALQRVEILSVARGVRRAARRTTSPAQLETLRNEVAPLGLTVTPIVNVVPSRAGYRAKLEYAKANEPFDISCVIARNDDGRTFVEASRVHDDDTVGELLGIPVCCRAFFGEVWHRQKMIDTTWPMAWTSSTVTDDSIIVDSGPETNVMLRWLGVRLVLHLPCSFHCRGSIRFARRLAEVAIREGHGAGVTAAWQMLSWSMEWSALHGIAEVRTPVFKIAVDTDATGRRYLVQLRGRTCPEDAERGLRFPYLVAKALNSIGESRHAENGFANASAMLFAHLELLNILDPIVDRIEGSIVDLGCGTGDLLRSLGAGKKNVTLHGVDRDERKITLATATLGRGAKLHAGNYLDKNGPWLGERHALIVGTLALCESEDGLGACLRVISSAKIAVFYYYNGYRGDVTNCLLRLKTLLQSVTGKSLTQIGCQCWAVHDEDMSLPNFSTNS